MYLTLFSSFKNEMFPYVSKIQGRRMSLSKILCNILDNPKKLALILIGGENVLEEVRPILGPKRPLFLFTKCSLSTRVDDDFSQFSQPFSFLLL